MIKIVYSSNVYTWKSITEIEHGLNNELKTVTHSTQNDSNITIEKIVIYSFIYNDQNRIVKRIAQPLKADHEEDDHTYSYDPLGRLIADTTFYRQTTKVDKVSVYSWNADNNVIKYEDFAYNNLGNLELASFTDYSYDHMNNFYFDISSIVYYLDGFIGVYMSNNNFIEFKHGGNLSDIFTHQYNSNGLLSKTISQPVANTALTTTFDYFYQ